MTLKKLSENLLNTVLTNEVAFPICNNILTNKTGITKMAFCTQIMFTMQSAPNEYIKCTDCFSVMVNKFPFFFLIISRNILKGGLPKHKTKRRKTLQALALELHQKYAYMVNRTISRLTNILYVNHLCSQC